jgi:hypothetical protein
VTIDEQGQPAYPYAIGRQWYGEVSGSAINEITEETTVLIEAGPSSELTVRDPSVDSSSDTITLTWASIEGGKYSIQSSSDLQAWGTVQDQISSSALTAEKSVSLTGKDSLYYRVVLDAVEEYDSEGSAGGNGDPGGPPGGGGGAEPGSGNPVDGFIFSFRDMPPAQNLVTNIRVGTVSGTVVNYFSQGTQGGTMTLKFAKFPGWIALDYLNHGMLSGLDGKPCPRQSCSSDLSFSRSSHSIPFPS